VLLSDQTPGPFGQEGDFAIVTKSAAAGEPFLLDSDVLLAPIPRPVTTAGGPLPDRRYWLALRVDAPTAGVDLDPACAQSVVLGYKIYQQVLPPTGSPPLDLRRELWSLAEGGEGPDGSPIPFGSTATVTLAPWCHGWRYHFAVSLGLDGGFETAHLSRPIQAAFGIPEWTDEDCDGFEPFTPDGQEVLDCDDGDARVYPGAPQVCDHRNNDCLHPSWPLLTGTNEEGPDLDGDSWTGSCDNCPLDPNASQGDVDSDGAGDACDTADGLILLRFALPDLAQWQEEQGFDSWNLYRGSLDVLRSSGLYTQAPGSNPIARRECGIPSPSLGDPGAPASGQVAFYLVSGMAMGVESGLGTDSAGRARPNANPCP